MKTLLLIPLLCLASCSLLQEKKDPLKVYIHGTGTELTISAQEIEEALTQYGSMGAGTYKIKAIVLTPALLELKEKSKPFNEETTRTHIAEAKKSFTENKTCFQIFLTAINSSKYAYFEEWSGRIFVEDNKLEFPLQWTEESLKTKPKAKGAGSFSGKTEHYFNEGMACTESPVPLEKGFTLKLLPSFIQWPFDGSLDLSWNFIDPQTKSPKKVKEVYRGW